MEREARGDAELSRDFEAVMEAHEGALLRYATGLLRDAHAAQDVVQNVFVKLFRSRPAARAAAAYSVRAWLYRVAHNEAVDYLRHEGRLRSLHENHGREAALRKDKAGGAGGDGRMELALQCVDRLDAAEREVLLLRLQEGLSYREISRVTGRTEGNTGCLLHHAVRKVGSMVRRMDALEAGRPPPGQTLKLF
ncbi:MAG: sigma-70 family RNA polymerase sigma factor [Lentisphaerae bacterium]|nr:sigma-70 family RNA polymerase sigma factor [Lentisphaerota bacterium]